MCNDYQQHIAWEAYCAVMHALELGIPTDQDAIAGLWRKGAGDDSPAFTMLTTDPSADVAPYHSRQIVVLPSAEWASWLYLTKPEAELLRPLPTGSLRVENVRAASD